MAPPPSMARRPSTWNCFPIRPDARLRKLEQNFVLDCVAAEKQQQRFEHIQPKLWSIIPAYNSQRDRHAASYYANPRVQALLQKTGQVRKSDGIGRYMSYVDKNQLPQQQVQIKTRLFLYHPSRPAQTDGFTLLCQQVITENTAVIQVGCAVPSNQSVLSLQQVEVHRGGTSVGGWVADYYSIFGEPQKYLNRRNWQGSGHSPGYVYGHNLFLSDARPMNGYNGRYGFRRTTPALRRKPSEFGVDTPFSLY
uniref:Uncharacterized protein C17orf98-like n=1 Tax=Geotrypetes seraphini TaxID=260995 RepID=A0A6P8QDH7_GEOSA|nr:uncharacterized protein C17orf98-like [Geotrypetes seraphini]